MRTLEKRRKGVLRWFCVVGLCLALSFGLATNAFAVYSIICVFEPDGSTWWTITYYNSNDEVTGTITGSGGRVCS